MIIQQESSYLNSYWSLPRAQKCCFMEIPPKVGVFVTECLDARSDFWILESYSGLYGTPSQIHSVWRSASVRYGSLWGLIDLTKFLCLVSEKKNYMLLISAQSQGNLCGLLNEKGNPGINVVFSCMDSKQCVGADSDWQSALYVCAHVHTSVRIHLCAYV